MSVAIVADSTSDIDPQRAAALGVTIVPLFVLWGEKSYRDYVDLSRARFYELLASEPMLPATSQPSSAMFEEAYAPAVARGDQILCITISSRLSGTINAARAAAAQFPCSRIVVVDSKSVSAGCAMLVERALERAKAGVALDGIVAELESESASQRLYACLPDLSHVIRTGRIGGARAAIGTLMKIVPVLTLADGIVEAKAQVRTFARAQETMLDLALENAPDPAVSRYIVIHTNALQLAQSILGRLTGRLGGVVPKLLEIREAGPVIAVHGGPGAVGIFSDSK